MAYLLAHTLIGKRVLDSLPKHTVANEADFYLGCVGPDMFFFDRIPPTPFKPNKKALGNLMHKQSGNALFGAFLNAQQGDGQNTSLIYGFLCHLALDACVHPYIESQHRGLNHTRFEVLIDMQLYRVYCNEILRPTLRQSGADVIRADALISRVAHALTGQSEDGAYCRSYTKFLRVHRLLWDPTGKRLKIARFIDRVIAKDNCLAGFVMATELEDSVDCRNLMHRPWAAPWDKDNIRTESFDELFDRAHELATEWIGLLHGGNAQMLLNKLAHYSMDRGFIS